MALKADVTYRSTPFTGAVFELGAELHIRVPTDGTPAVLSFEVRVWPSEAAYVADEEPVPLPEWSANAVAWDPEGAAPAVQAYAYVTAKLGAAGATNIEEV